MRARTSDGKRVAVSPATARRSRVLAGLKESFADREIPEIVLPGVASEDLRAIGEMCDREDAASLALADALATRETADDRRAPLRLAREHSEWKRVYLEGMQDRVQSVMASADYLDVDCVMDACSENLADLIKSRSPEEIREYFGVRRRS